MFIKLTDPENNPVYIKSSEIKALIVSEFPRAQTAILIGDNPDGAINVVETLEEVIEAIDKEDLKANLTMDYTQPECSFTDGSRIYDEDLISREPILDEELFRELSVIYGCRIDIFNKGYHWRVACANTVGDYYPTTETYNFADSEGKSKSAFKELVEFTAKP